MSWGNSGYSIGIHNEHLHLWKPDGSVHSLIVAEGDITALDWVIIKQ